MRNGNTAAMGRREFPGCCSFFFSKRKLREDFGRSANLRAGDRPRELFETATEAGSKTEELLRLILLKSCG